eukprot:3696880-Pyramimonas_sp.AAC.1
MQPFCAVFERPAEPPRAHGAVRKRLGMRDWSRFWTPEMGTERMGTMPNSKCCPEPTAAAVGQAAF